MKAGPTVVFNVHFVRGSSSRRVLLEGAAPDRGIESLPAARVPHLSRLMALALRLQALVQSGAIQDYASASRLGGVTRARLSQIVALLNLASDIQAAILELPPNTGGRDRISERDIRPITGCVEWDSQRHMWEELLRRAHPRRDDSHRKELDRAPRSENH